MTTLDMSQIVTSFHDVSINMLRWLGPTVKTMFLTLTSIDLTLSMLFNKDDGLDIFMTLMKKIMFVASL